MANIFYNDEIYNSNLDYVLGGFMVNENDKINYDFIHQQIVHRTHSLIEDYYLRCISANLKAGREFTLEDAQLNLGLMFYNNLGYAPKRTDFAGLANDIFQSDNMIKWLDETIKPRVLNYLQDNIPQNLPPDLISMGIPSFSEKAMFESPELFQEAKEATEDATLEEFFEKLSLIEL